MRTKKLLLEDINRIKLMSSYDSKRTSIENEVKILNERITTFKGLQDLLASDRGAVSAFKTDMNTFGKNLKLYTEGGRTAANELKTTTEVIAAMKNGKISATSMADIGAAIFKGTKNVKLMEACAEDIVKSTKFVETYRNLKEADLIEALARSKMKVVKGSEQMNAILKANERILADEARIAFDEFRNVENSLPFGGFKSQAEYDKALKDFFEQNRTVTTEVANAPKTVFEKLKNAGLLIWKGGAWIIGNSLWILLFGGLAYGVWKYFSSETGVKKENEDGRDGSSNDDIIPIIQDDQGNVYNPCSGVYKVGCVTSETNENGLDFISQAQDCLGLSPTGQFNKELETKLISKIHKRSFTKDDMKYICMRGGTLSRL